MHDAPFQADHAAVRHILTAPAVRRRTASYLGLEDFDWQGLLVEQLTMSGGQALLVDIAYELWHAQKTVGLWEVVRRLDPQSFEHVVDALAISRGVAAPMSRAA